MKQRIAATTVLFTLFISACATAATPQLAPEPATATEAVPTLTETSVPATETSAPATEAPTVVNEPPVSGSGGNISFANDVLPIFQASCADCHGGREIKEGLNLTTYEGVITGSFNGTVITPGSANESYLAQQVIEGEMPKRGPHLADDQIQIIVDWINQGAINN